MDDETRTLHGDQRGVGPELRKWGPFDLIERVGHGGFGEVYRGFDPALRREVAVKLLLPGTGDMPALLREARAMAQVTHPNLVPIYGVDTREGRAGFWSAFVHGKTLSELLKLNGPFGPQETILIGLDLCRAVSAVHGAGLLHCDIKTGNVMREAGGRILLMDFGLTESAARQTVRGGTPGYMAPEILTGGQSSVRSDVFAIGVLLYHLLTGKYPEREKWSLLELRPDLAAPLVQVIHRAMHADPAQRFATAAELASALADAGGVPILQEKSKRFAIAVAAGVLLAAAGFGYSRLMRHNSLAAPARVQAQYEKAHDLVQHYYRPKALETAIPQLERITREAPEFALAYADLGRANFLQFWQLREVKYEAPARDASLKAVALYPNLAAAHVTLGMLYTQTDKNDPAAQELDKALNIDRLDAEAWAARSELYMRQGRTDDAEAAIRKAMDLAPSDWRWPKQLSDFYYRTGRTDLAIKAGGDVVRLSPDNARAYNNLGLYLSSAGQLPEAETALRKALDLEAGYNRYTNLGKVLRDLGKAAEAEKMVQAAIDLNPDDYRAWNYLAEIYRETEANSPRTQRTFRKAIELAESLRAIKPREVYLLADLGVMYATIGDSEHALPLFRQAIALSPENNEVLFQSGVGYEMLHQRDRAIEIIGEALRQGYSRRAAEQDRDIVELRKDPRYVAIVSSLR